MWLTYLLINLFWAEAIIIFMPPQKPQPISGFCMNEHYMQRGENPQAKSMEEKFSPHVFSICFITLIKSKALYSSSSWDLYYEIELILIKPSLYELKITTSPTFPCSVDSPYILQQSPTNPLHAKTKLKNTYTNIQTWWESLKCQFLIWLPSSHCSAENLMQINSNLTFTCGITT